MEYPGTHQVNEITFAKLLAANNGCG